MKNSYFTFLLLLLLIIINPFNSFTNAQWFWQNPLPQGNDLQGVSFASPYIGKAVGLSGALPAAAKIIPAQLNMGFHQLVL